MAEITAEAPSNIFAHANILLIKHRIINTTCATRPYRTRTTSNDVWASGILRLHDTPSNAKNTIMGLQPAANQNGPATP
jgi:hypothetical protein